MAQGNKNKGNQQGGDLIASAWQQGYVPIALVPIHMLSKFGIGATLPSPGGEEFSGSMRGGPSRQFGQGGQRNKQINRVTISGDAETLGRVSQSAKAKGLRVRGGGY